VFWSSKKHNSVALSTTEAEYVAAGACCAQLLWMKQTLSDFGCEFSKISLLYDNESAIKLANNPVQHSRTKHINIRHHFLQDHEAKRDIALHHVSTERQLADIFTKPLDECWRSISVIFTTNIFPDFTVIRPSSCQNYLS
jgi:hypothetical protein